MTDPRQHLEAIRRIEDRIELDDRDESGDWDEDAIADFKYDDAKN